MRYKNLLGATVNREIVFGEFEITNRNGSPEFTASFDTVRPFNGNDIDLEVYFEDCVVAFGKDWAYDACEKYHCAPQDLPAELAAECDDPRDAMDCSLYPECIDVDGNDWYFESGSCGQCDTRDEMEVYVNKGAYDRLIKLWDEYHLKEIGEEVRKEVEAIHDMLVEIDEEEWIANYIRENF